MLSSPRARTSFSLHYITVFLKCFMFQIKFTSLKHQRIKKKSNTKCPSNPISLSPAAAAAAAAKSLQSCPTLCDPIDGSPPGSPVPGILQARTLEWVAISSSNA